MTIRKFNQILICAAIQALLLTGCRKWIEIDAPVDTITTENIFASDKEAEWAMSGVYSKLINGSDFANVSNSAKKNFGSGLATILGGLSSDELVMPPTSMLGDYIYLSSNSLTVKTSGITTALWNTAYKTIFDANGVIEGIASSKSVYLTNAARQQLTGEALAVRAFCYFYLVNFFGELPLALSVDFNQTAGLSRTPVSKIYEQIISDLQQAKMMLGTDFSTGNGERVRINKWFAEALLARVHLYTGNYQQAITSASAVINEAGLFGIEQDLANVFLKNSREAIFQLKQTNADYGLKNATPEGAVLNPAGAASPVEFNLSASAIAAFGPSDDRFTKWTNIAATATFPNKYKTGGINAAFGGEQREYYMVMRLAELYLIRAEATAQLPDGNPEDAIEDINVLRRRANAGELPLTLTKQQVIDAVARERRLELFAEWGHRWLDLKRTGRAPEVLSAITYKQPWVGDFQLLYPIPEGEIKNNNRLTQNPQYNIQ